MKKKMFDISLHLNGRLDLIKQFSMQNIDFIICKLLQKYLHSFKKIKFNAWINFYTHTTHNDM